MMAGIEPVIEDCTSMAVQYQSSTSPSLMAGIKLVIKVHLMTS
jgi:hypothetical protein